MASFSREHLRNHLEGPIFPVLTPFVAGGSAVDHDALTRYVEFLAGAGVPAVLSTVGTSRFNLLSDEEIKAVNTTIAQTVAGRCIVILAGPPIGTTATNVEFARHAESVGADAYIAFFPERYYGMAPVVAFFDEVSSAVEIGTMIHEMPMRSGYGGNQQYPIDLLDRLLDLPGVVGMKEECMDGGYAYHIHRRLGQKCGIIGAGSKRLFMRDFHAGAKAYLVGIGSFFPRVAMDFYAAMREHRLSDAHAIVHTYEDPYFELAVSLGWHLALKETLHILGLMPPHERNPLPRLTTSQQQELKTCVEKLGWRDRDPTHSAAI